MRPLIRCAAKLYPTRWRNRYGAELDALFDDIAPSFGDVCDVLGHALRARVIEFTDARLMLAAVMPFRLSVLVSATAHVMLLGSLVLASWSSLTPMPFHAIAAPLPPPAPDPPPQITDPRVFPESSMLYSSLPLKIPNQGGTLFTSVIYGVGINFPSLPDAGARDRRRKPERRVWPGRALENVVVRRVLPQYPQGTEARGAVSVFVEYLIAVDGSVKVLRSSGPTPFTDAARSAIERWVYRPITCENRLCEVVSRVEVRFDGTLTESESSR
jgi:hypothetical protein